MRVLSTLLLAALLQACASTPAPRPRPEPASSPPPAVAPTPGTPLAAPAAVAAPAPMSAPVAKPTPPNPREVIRDDDQRGQSPAEQRLAQALAGGIRPAEGAEAFLRAIAADGAQVLVSSLDLEALVKQANAPVVAQTEGPGFARPELETDYVAPRNSVERTLAGFWPSFWASLKWGSRMTSSPLAATPSSPCASLR